MTAKRVVIADDSELFIDVLSDLVRREPGLSLVGVAKNGRDAVSQVKALRPDLVVMDVLMPELDGLAATEQIMAEQPTPILILSSDPRSRTGRLSLEALARGALEAMPKPEQLPFEGRAKRGLLDRMRLLADVAVVRHVRGRRHQWREPEAPPPSTRRPPVMVSTPIVAIAASTGGPQALVDVVSLLPVDLRAAVLVVQHMSDAFLPVFAEWLQKSTALVVSIAQEGTSPVAGHIYVAGAGRHLELKRGCFSLPGAEPEERHCPSADRLFASLARDAPGRTYGVVLTGMGRDGTSGLLHLRQAGGETAAQDASSSVVDGMPRAAREAGAAAKVLPLASVASELVQWAEAQ